MRSVSCQFVSTSACGKGNPSEVSQRAITQASRDSSRVLVRNSRNLEETMEKRSIEEKDHTSVMRVEETEEDKGQVHKP